MDESADGSRHRGALSGVRVVDLSRHAAGGIAAMFLGDLGADVVRDAALAVDTRPGAVVWHRGKRLADLDVMDLTAGGDGWAGVDVVVVDDPVAGPAPGTTRTVVLEVPPGMTGAEWSIDDAADAALAATLGAGLRQHSDAPGPVDLVVPVLTYVHGTWAAAAAVAALVERESSGRGQRVVVDGARGAMVAFSAGLEIGSSAEPAVHAGDGGGRLPFYRTYRCADGEWLFLAALTPRFTELGFGALGVSGLLDDPRLEGGGRAAAIRPENLGWVTEAVAGVFATRTRDEWLTRLHDAGCPAGPVLARDEWLDHPQIEALGMRVEVDDPVHGHVVMPGTPLAFERTPASVHGPGPDPRAVPASGWPSPEWGLVEPTGGPPWRGPLDGVRVLDLGAIIAGPYAGSLLAELGADVVKVEPPTGDSFRGPGFAPYNKGQRSLAIDLRRPDGRDALLAAVRGADVVIDNYRPGVLGRLRLEHRDLVEVNPQIVSLSVTGFGDHGPLGSEAGFDPVLQAMSGMMDAQGGSDAPVFFSIPVNDVSTAATAALGVVAAVLHARRTGVGQRVATSLAAVSALVQAEELVRYGDRPVPRCGGRDHRGPAPLDRYHRASDGWVRLISDPDAAADGLVALGLEATDASIGAWVGDRTREQAVAALLAAGIHAVAARAPVELVTDDALVAHGVLRRDPRPGREDRWTAGRFVDLDRTPVPETSLAPALGEHSEEVLVEAGLDEEAIRALVDDGVVVVR